MTTDWSRAADAMPSLGVVAAAICFLISLFGMMRRGRHDSPWRIACAVLFLGLAAWPIASSAASRGLSFPFGGFVSMAGIGIVFSLLAAAGGRSEAESHRGYKFVLSGFWLLFIEAGVKAMAAAKMFGASSGVASLLSELFCMVPGICCLAIGFFLWLPMVRELAAARRELEGRRAALEAVVEERTAELVEEVVQRRAAEKKALAANEAKSSFLANMSHELRTPLNAVIGFSDILKGDMATALGPDKTKEYAGDINDAGRHLLDVVNDVLDLAKIESGKMEIAMEAMDCGQAMARAAALSIAKAAERGIAFDCDEAGAAGFAAFGDQRGVRQILINLISNAVKFTGVGGQVRVRAERGEGTVSIAVADTGRGIPADKIDKVFEPFEQIDNAYARAEGGTGLGLALSRRLAELMGGELRLESEEGVGTTAFLILKAA